MMLVLWSEYFFACIFSSRFTCLSLFVLCMLIFVHQLDWLYFEGNILYHGTACFIIYVIKGLSNHMTHNITSTPDINQINTLNLGDTLPDPQGDPHIVPLF